MTIEGLEIPTYEDLGRELAEGLDFDSLDLWEAIDTAEEAGNTRLSEKALEGLSEREVRMLVLETKLRLGEGFTSKIFGIVVRVEPASPEEISGYGGSDPHEGGGDPSGDREPRSPIPPTVSGTAEQDLVHQR